MSLVDGLRQDLSYGWRVLRKRPAPNLLAVAALALGIGAGTAIFSIINAVLIQSLPYREPDRLVMLWNVNEREGFDLKQQKAMGRSLSTSEYLDWRSQTDIFERMIIFGPFLTRITRTDDPEMIHGYRTSPGVFPLLGVTPLLGRDFQPEEEREGADPVVVLQYALWKRRFHGDPGVLGQKMYMGGGRPHTIIGVMRPEFVLFNRQMDAMIPAQWRMEATERARGQRWFRAMGRLKPGLSLKEAQARADAFSAALARQHPETNGNWRVVLVPAAEDSAGELRPAMLVLLAAVGCVLLITCANVTNLLLVQASARSKELALRTALGAGRLRLIRQMLTESLLLALAGGVLGLGLAYGIVRYFQMILPDRFNHGKYLLQAESIRVDPTVVGFAVAVALFSSIVFGLVPALKASKPDLNQALKDIGGGSLGGGRGRTARTALVVGEVAIAVVLVVSATLLVRSFLALYDRGPGYRPEGLLSMQVTMSWEDVEEQVRAKKLPREEARKLFMAADRAFRDRLYGELSSVPGLGTFTATAVIPVNGYYQLTDLAIEGRAPEPAGQAPQAIWNSARAGYFELLGVPLLGGRYFGREDGPEAPRSAIVSQEVVRRHFAAEDPIGKRLKWNWGGAGSEQPWMTIVGVVGDIREDGMDRPPQPYVYQCDEQTGFPGYLIVRAKSGDPTTIFPAVRRAIKMADPKATIYRALKLDYIVRSSAWRLNYSMVLLTGLAALALMLAVVGVYGVLSYAVRERAQEIGIRMALGAEPSQVLALVVKQGLVMVAAGVGIGLLAASLLTRFLRSLLFGVGPLDPASFAAVALALLAAGCLASYLPARRATRVDPMVALRYE